MTHQRSDLLFKVKMMRVLHWARGDLESDERKTLEVRLLARTLKLKLALLPAESFQQLLRLRTTIPTHPLCY
jgi:hypothetical protein